MIEITLSVEEVQNQLEDLLDRLQAGTLDRVNITKDGIPYVVMVPYDEYQRMKWDLREEI